MSKGDALGAVFRFLNEADDSVSPPEHPTTIGRYRIVRTLAAGGMGVLYVAQDLELNRTVALKVMRGLSELNEGRRQRFIREARAAAQISHPNVVKVHDAGEIDGRLFIAMELVDGVPLSETMILHRGDFVSLVRVLEGAARGVAAAHERGIIHRDLKPANILISKDGTPKMADFGLAHQVEGTAMTARGAMMGTPLYMAPEQIEGREITTRTDVYALGAILYEILTGRTPYALDHMAQLFALILQGEPVSPHRLEPHVPRELESICLKALDRDPGRRYPSAREFADDLYLFLKGETVVLGASRTFRKWVVGVAVLCLVVIATVSLLWRRARTQEASERLDRARATLEAALRGLYDKEVTHERMSENVDRALGNVAEVADVTPGSVEAAYLSGCAWELKGAYDRAEGVWRAALSRAPRLSVARFRLGRLLAVRAYLGSIVCSCATCVETRQKVRERTRAEAERMAAEAVREMEAALKEGMDDPLQHEIALGILSYLRGEKRNVLAAAERFEGQLGSEDLYWLAALTAERGQAVRLLDRAIGLCPKHALALYARGGAQAAAGDVDRALADYSEAIRVNPRFTRAYFARAIARARMGDISGAISDYGDALALEPGFVEAFCNRGSLRAKTGDRAGGLDDCNHALDLDPGYWPSYRNRGLIRHALEDWDAALKDYSEAIRLAPEIAVLHLDRAKVHVVKRTFDLAQADARRAIELGSRDAEAFYLRGQARMELGDKDAAREDFDEAIRRRSDFYQAYALRGGVRFQAGDWDGAIADYSRHLQSHPCPEVYFSRASAHLRNADDSAALQDYEAALAHAPATWPCREKTQAQIDGLRARK